MNHYDIMKKIDGLIWNTFSPKPIEFLVNDKWFLATKLSGGWKWRNEDGDGQEDYGIEPFAEAYECQQSAIAWMKERLRRAA